MEKITIFSLMGITIILIGIMGYLTYSEFKEHSDEHVHSVEIEGKELRLLTVQEVADLWEIDSGVFLSRIITEFDLKENYTIDTVLEDIRGEYAFSPAIIKDISEEIKQGGLQNE